MESGSAVARTTSRMARPRAASAAPPRSPHVREEASLSGLLDPQERTRLDAREEKQEGEKGGRLGLPERWGAPPPPLLIYPGGRP